MATILSLSKNPVTGITSAFYEPALDYVTIKMPRWDLSKFSQVDRSLGSTMKSVGEVMAIGRNFPEAIQKAYRMVYEDSLGISKFYNDKTDKQDFKPSDDRLILLFNALRQKKDPEALNLKTGVDRWFLSELRKIITVERDIALLVTDKVKTEKDLYSELSSLHKEMLHLWKVTGFSDEQIAFVLLSELSNQRGFGAVDREDTIKLSLHVRKVRVERELYLLLRKSIRLLANIPHHQIISTCLMQQAIMIH